MPCFVAFSLAKTVDIGYVRSVCLVGVVVNNAILLVHQTLNFMKGRGESETDFIEKMGYREAIRESVRTRMRPIFMTSSAAWRRCSASRIHS